MNSTPPVRQLYDTLSPAARRLARVPRLARLIGRLPPSRLTRLGQSATPADVFWEVYNYDTNDDNQDCGLLADGLKTRQARRMAWRRDSDPPDSFRPYQVQRARDLLGAIAFALLAKTDANGKPAPWWNGVTSDLTVFRTAVMRRFLRAEALITLGGEKEYEGYFLDDWDSLLRMDSHGLKHFIFSTDARDQQLRWSDITTMAFFAAYWACRWATPGELEQTRRWVYDPWDDTKAGFREFWAMAADMPDEAIDHPRWTDLFAPLYGRKLLDDENFPIRSTGFIYRSWKRMQGTQAQQDFLKEFPALVAQGDPIAAEISSAWDNPHFRPIRAGTFWMGAQDGEEGASDDERPRHQVTLSAFRMYCHAVTNAQYELFAPGHHRHRGRFDGDSKLTFNDDRRPVVNVSWYDTWCFAQWTGNHLPTEAQWEYSCRGGASCYQIFHFGNTLISTQANFDGNFPYGINGKGKYLKCTTEVGWYEPNAFGLFDMHGNVREWCADWYAEDFYKPPPGKENESVRDPVNEGRASARVLRGGSWLYGGRVCRSANRRRYVPDFRLRACGFRLAAVPRIVGAKGAGKADKA